MRGGSQELGFNGSEHGGGTCGWIMTDEDAQVADREARVEGDSSERVEASESSMRSEEEALGLGDVESCPGCQTEEVEGPIQDSLC